MTTEKPAAQITLKEAKELSVSPQRRLFSASEAEIIKGLTSDVYFVKTREVLEEMSLHETHVVAEVFARNSGVFAGTLECANLLRDLPIEVWSLPEGAEFAEKQVVMRISGPYGDFGIYETAILGILASSCAWASASRECKDAAVDKPMYCFGARHVHPAVAPVMERAAIIGGADGCACILGARLAGRIPVGTMPHALFLIVGDTLEGALAYDRAMPPDDPRTVLIDTFKDEAEEALRVAEALGSRFAAVRLDTPSERGGVTPDLVKEVRFRLDLAGRSDVKIFVSGGLTPERIRLLSSAGAHAFGVGSYISGAKPIDMTMDIKQVSGRPVAKRGRLPGISETNLPERII